MGKKEDATQNAGVSEVGEKELTTEEKENIEQKGREMAARLRLSAIDEIAAKVDKQRVEEDGMKLEVEEGEPASEEEKEKKEEPPSEEEEAAGAEDEEEEEQEEEEELVTLIVDGEEMKVPLSKVKDAGIRTLQKEAAADKRLEEATALRKQYEELVEQAKKAAELPSKADEDAQDKKTPEEERADFEEKKKAWIQAIQYGDEEEAGAAIDEIIEYAGRGRRDVIPAEEIKSMVDEALKEREEAQKAQTAEQIRQKFFAPVEQGGFADLAENPYLMAETKRIVDEKLAAGEPNTWETYEAAGKQVREAMQAVLGQKAQEKVKVTGMDKKKEKKKNIDNVKPAEGKQTTETPDREKTLEEARAEAAREIMKARGQIR